MSVALTQDVFLSHSSKGKAATTGPFPLRLDRGEGQGEVSIRSYQLSTINCPKRNPPANGSNASRNGWRTVGF